MGEHTRFKDVKDFSEEGFDRNSPKMFAEAQYQRVRENKVAIEEMKQLQEQLYQCYFRHAPDHYSQCKDLAMDYHRRLNWQDNIPPAGFADSESRLRRTDDGGLTFERK